jgi:hypothetical protein
MPVGNVNLQNVSAAESERHMFNDLEGHVSLKVGHVGPNIIYYSCDVQQTNLVLPACRFLPEASV